MVKTPPGPDTGKRYGGRYEVQGSIASGGMAEVFVARDLMLDRLVALKLMHAEYARDTAFIERFRREAQAAASLNDPRIVAIYDWGSDEGTYFIVMEYVKGNTLSEIIRASGPLPIPKSVRIASDVLAGLELAHQNGIVHRDVKPANIAITVNGQTKVMDFGIARAALDGAMEVTQTGMVIGTASYFSPEQAQGKPVDNRSDIYSVGIVLYEMLTGVVPFKGESPVAVAYKHVAEPPSPPRSLADDIPPALESVVMKALAKNPDNRYQTAGEMRLDLQRALKGEQVEATPVLSEQEQTNIMAASGYAPHDPYAGTDPTNLLPPPPPAAPASSGGGLGKFLVTLAILLAVGAGAAAYIMFSENAPPNVTVPNVTGRTFEEAQQILDGAGLRARISRRQPSSDVPALSVLSQDPEDGRKVAEGAEVALVISQGPETVEIPDLEGMTKADAEAALAEAGLAPGTVTLQSSDSVPEGVVISQSPASGTLEKGALVDFVVSSGKSLVVVPDVVGSSAENAESELSEVGLGSSTVTDCSSGNPNGTVIGQDPGAGQELEEGAEVELTVNELDSVPNVLNRSTAQATQILENAGYAVEVVNALPIPVFDQVKDQAPGPSDGACEGDTIKIQVT